ncbi:carbon-nitrogen hydrolase [Gigaspora margarita]|uniref:Carbon-nitrogen hydrolase n=1 Tax=Gigaspora margarita TaxID=4874 RepID=A0A8H4ASV6_GIGMA|nr:carbon-nitrogen hydrolase [Gigaspora margarita]
MDRIHYLIPLFLILTCFGPGFQTISIFTWIWFPLTLSYCRTVAILWFIPVYIANSIGTALAYLGSLNSDNTNWLPEYFLLSATFGFGMNILLCISLILDRLAQNVFKGWPRFFVFPCTWTALWLIFLYVSFLGDLTNYMQVFRYIFLGDNEMIQFASFAGLGGLNFILSWGGTTGAHMIEVWIKSNFGNALHILLYLEIDKA